MMTNATKELVPVDSLNEDQKKAFEELRDFIVNRSDDRIYVLKGWAGTGKTYCISILIRYVLEVIHKNNKWYKIAVTGPTNKSVKVIKRASSIRSPRVMFQTIHKLLGLQEKITPDGKQEFVSDYGSSQIGNISLLIIDEVSMLNDELFEEIIKHRDRIKIICMGDPAQIPPVGRPDCIPFRDDLLEKYGIETLSLKKIMRQKSGNPIIDSSIKIRENIEDSSKIVDPVNNLLENGEGIEFLDINVPDVRKNFRDTLSKYFKSKEFENDAEYTKIIAWRNKTVSTMNDLVRKIIFGDESEKSKILPGEKLIANNPIIRNGSVIFPTNEEFTVVSYELDSEKFIFPYLEIGETNISFYKAKVKYYDDDFKQCSSVIYILHEDSQSAYDMILSALKKYAIRVGGKDKAWLKYYEFMREYDDVGYSYSITAHKSQGSTYQYSFVFEDDINLNIDVIERNRIKYTAYTRASKKLYVIRAT